MQWYHVCWPRRTAKRVEPVVSISWASCFTLHVRTWNSMFARQPCQLYVRRWSFTFARRHGWRTNVKLYVPTWNSTFARQPCIRAWSVKKLAGWPLRATVHIRLDSHLQLHRQSYTLNHFRKFHTMFFSPTLHVLFPSLRSLLLYCNELDTTVSTPIHCNI